MTTHVPFPFYQYWFCVLGILISIIVPILRRLIPKPTLESSEITPWQRYLGIGLFSLITAIVLVAVGRDRVSSWEWFDAFLVGYAWDSTFQKLTNG